MKHGLTLLIGFLVIIINSSCNSSTNKELSHHISEVSMINRNIPIENWEVSISYKGKLEHRYELERTVNDTSNFLSFSFFPEGKCYAIDGFTITFFDDSVYNELSIINDDTMYHFIADTHYQLIKERPGERTEKRFLKGKAYYIDLRRLPVESLEDPIY